MSESISTDALLPKRSQSPFEKDSDSTSPSLRHWPPTVEANSIRPLQQSLANVQTICSGKKPSEFSTERGGNLANISDVVEASKDGIPYTHLFQFDIQSRHLKPNTNSVSNKGGSDNINKAAEYPRTQPVDITHIPPALHSSGRPKSPTRDSLSIDPLDTSQLPPFDIEKHGDPRISWFLYYDFVVTKSEAYYELQPGYLASKNFPIRKDNKEIHE
jgi:hypothetical protein